MPRTPVIFVPGLCGSFNLGVLLDWRGPTLNGWGFPPFIDYGKNMTASFLKAGYTRDQDFFVAFYDWRKSISDAATLYLKPWIDRAKQRSGATKVVLVGHSMGGLVARSYIQSRAYGGDVEALITLGTPHRGSGQTYYTWGGGELRSDPGVQAVFNVYLWYLRHAHPFQTELNPLRTIRTQVPSLRDLLPIDDYLYHQDAPARPKPENDMVERNLVGDMLNLPAAVATLLGRVPVLTIGGVGSTTIRGLTVGAPPTPPGDPAVYPDGKPLSDLVNSDGDGTVLTANARLEHQQVENSAPLAGVGHGSLPDDPAVLARVFNRLGVTSPVLGAAPAPAPRLVIMTASPVVLDVATPGGPPLQPADVLGAGPVEGPPRRTRVVRGKDHGHSGKHLNIAVIAKPVAGDYQVHLTGTGTGTFSLGAMLVGPEGVTMLGGAGAPSTPEPRATAITTRDGRVAAGAELYYTVTVQSLEAAPEVTIDRERTAAGALGRMRDAIGGGVLGASAEGGDPIDAILGGAADPAAQVDALCAMAQSAIGAADPALATAIIAELRALQE